MADVCTTTHPFSAAVGAVAAWGIPGKAGHGTQPRQRDSEEGATAGGGQGLKGFRKVKLASV